MASAHEIDKDKLIELFKNVDSSFQKLLITCSWLVPNEKIPLDLMMLVSEIDQQEEIKQKLSFLVSMNFLDRSKGEYLMTSKVSSLIQEIANPLQKRELLQATSRAMHSIINPLEKLDEFEPYQSHTEKLAQQGQINKIAAAGLLFGILGRFKLQSGENEEAVKFIRRALLIVEKVSGVDSVEHTENLNSLGSAMHRMGRFEDAKKCFEQAIIIDKKILGKEDPAVAVGHNNLGQVLIDMNVLDGAIIHLEKALEINTKIFGNQHYLVASGHYNLGMALLSIGDLPRARAQLELSLAKRKENYGGNHPEVAEAEHGLGMILQTIGNTSGAENHYLNAVKIFESYNTPGNLKLAASYMNLGGIYHLEGAGEKAKDYYLKALSIFETIMPESDKNIRDLKLQLQLIEVGMTMPELLEKMEAGADLPSELIEVLNQSFADEKAQD
jgi:tetratricopeptide (TPR) repeat protein